MLDDIKKTIDELHRSVTEKIEDRLNTIDDVIQSVFNSLSRLVDKFDDFASDIISGIADRLSDAIENISNINNNVLTTITNKIKDSAEIVSDAISEIKEKIASKLSDSLDSIRSAVDKISHAITTYLSKFADKVSDFRDDLLAKIESSISSLANSIQSAWTIATEKIKLLLNALLERLVEAIEQIVSWLDKLFDSVTDFVNEKIIAPLSKNAEDVKQIVSFKSEVLHKAFLGDYNDFDAFVKDLTDPPPALLAVAGLIGSLLLFQIASPAIAAVVAPALERLVHLSAKKFRPTLLSYDTVTTAYFRNIVSLSNAKDELALWGYNDWKIDALIESARPIPSPGAIQEAYLRGFITETQHDNLLAKHGYTSDDIKLFKALYYIIPPTSDIIRMAVREAFSPEVAEKFGQYEELPAAFVQWAEKQGLSKEWAERYWAAHWDLPSATLGFEMLHRGVIDENELKLLLRALDVMPFWRDKLIRLSYEPYTRVDVRRMYQLGILSYDDVVQSYRDLGYDDVKARNLAEFTVKYYSAEDKTELDEYRALTRSIYVNAYKKGVIDRNTAKEYLKALGYRDEDAELLLSIADAEIYVTESREDTIPKRSNTLKLVLDAYKRGLYDRSEAASLLSELLYNDDEIEYYLNLSDYELELALKNEYLDVVKELYVTRTIEKSEAISMLNKLFVSSRETNNLFDLWNIAREMRSRKPTEAQFRAALSRGIITREEYENELRGLGFHEKYVKMLSELAMR